MELLLLSNSTNYGGTMFSHAAEAFAGVSAGERGDLRPLRAGGLGRLRGPGHRRARSLRHRGRLRPPLERPGPGDPRGRRRDDGRRQHLPAARLPLRPRRDRRARRPRARGRDPLRRRLGRHQRRLPDDPHHQRHADLPAAELRGARPRAVPDQPPLHRRRPGLDLHGRDPRRADRGVPRGERLRRCWRCTRARGCGSAARPPWSPAAARLFQRRASAPSTTASTSPASSSSRRASTAADDRSREVLHDAARPRSSTARRTSAPPTARPPTAWCATPRSTRSSR